MTFRPSNERGRVWTDYHAGAFSYHSGICVWRIKHNNASVKKMHLRLILGHMVYVAEYKIIVIVNYPDT